MKILTVIQARTGSSRLPGKVLLPLGNRTVLLQMIDRVAAARLVGQVVVATTTEPEDDVIERHCRLNQILCFRGHPTDCLDRHFRALESLGGDAVVKIPSDCPLIDPRIIDRVLLAFCEQPGRYDYVSNLHPQSYPDGNDVEVMSRQALTSAFKEAKKPWEREHTTPFLWDNPERFRIGNVSWEKGIDLSRTLRWTLDYPEDYDFIRAVFDALHDRNPLFTLEEILELIERRPELLALNRRHVGDMWYERHRNDLKTLAQDTGQDFGNLKGEGS